MSDNRLPEKLQAHQTRNRRKKKSLKWRSFEELDGESKEELELSGACNTRTERYTGFT